MQLCCDSTLLWKTMEIADNLHFFSPLISKTKNRLCYIMSFKEQMTKTLASRKRIKHDKIYMLWEKYV